MDHWQNQGKVFKAGEFSLLMKHFLTILFCLVILTACNAQPKAQGEILKAKFSEKEVASGTATELIVDARNSGQSQSQFKIVIHAEGVDQGLVTLEPAGEMLFDLRARETTGEKRIKVTATSNTISTDYEFKVQWQDMEGRVLEERSVVLTVSKQIQKTGGGIFGSVDKSTP